MYNVVTGSQSTMYAIRMLFLLCTVKMVFRQYNNSIPIALVALSAPHLIILII